MNLRVTLVAAVLLTAAAAAPADLVLERTVRDRRLSPFGEETVSVRRERVYVSERRVLIEDLVFGRDLLIQLDRGSIVILQRTSRTATPYTREDLKGHRARFAERLRECAARVPGTSAAAEVGALLAEIQAAEGGGPAPEVKPGADTAELCRREVLPVRLDREGRRIAALWIAREPAGAALLEAYEWLGYFPPGLRDSLAAIGQVPLRWEGRFLDGLDRVEREERVSEVRMEPVPASRYEVPDGYSMKGPAFASALGIAPDPAGGTEDGDAEPERPAADAAPKETPPPDKREPADNRRPDRGRR